jgi:hypothetical protein
MRKDNLQNPVESKDAGLGEPPNRSLLEDHLTRHLRYKSIKMSNGSVAMGRRYPLMCYTRKDRELEREARWITDKRLMEEEARHRQEEHDRRREQEKQPLTEKIKEVVGVR